jgi:ATP-dependent Lhr-like helicase
MVMAAAPVRPTRMILPPSGSDSASFEMLHPKVRRWVWDQRWAELRDVQEVAIETILNGDRDVIITAATAAGKTEAAFLPICSSVVSETPPAGVHVLYVGPLKALINDQWRRLDGLCESLELPVHRWHGDVTATARKRLIERPDGILLITPESLEALFVRRGTEVRRIFEGLQFIVIDELHAFIGTERGMQLQSLLHRLERVLHRRVRRIGLSATLGDMAIASDFLRPNAESQGASIVRSDEQGSGLKLKLFGFMGQVAASKSAQADAVEVEDDDAAARSIAQHLFKNLRGSKNLVFANRRSEVERFADLLRRMCAAANLPEEFFAHHGSLSRELRFHVEAELKRDDRPMTVVCTSTLEMGIDIGAAKSVAQIGCPPSVASLRQRLGRSGRRGEPAILRLYIQESEVTERSSPQDAIRTQLVQTIAMVDLLLDRWIEPPNSGLVHGSTLVQQVLSLIAQYGGITAADAYALLCRNGPFSAVTPSMFGNLLRSLAAHDLVSQMKDGLLIHGLAGEKAVNHYEFYAAFLAADEYRLMTSGSQLGTLPIENPVSEGSFLIFAGRRWRILSVDPERRVIDLAPAAGGRVPIFTAGAPGNVDDRVRMEMLRIYLGSRVPVYLDQQAKSLLEEGRANFRRYALDQANYIPYADGSLYFPWCGDLALNTLQQQLAGRGFEVALEGPALVAEAIDPGTLREAVLACEAERPVDVIALAKKIDNKIEEKWDWALDDETLCASYASRAMRTNPATALVPMHEVNTP